MTHRWLTDGVTSLVKPKNKVSRYKIAQLAVLISPSQLDYQVRHLMMMIFWRKNTKTFQPTRATSSYTALWSPGFGAEMLPWQPVTFIPTAHALPSQIQIRLCGSSFKTFSARITRPRAHSSFLFLFGPLSFSSLSHFFLLYKKKLFCRTQYQTVSSCMHNFLPFCFVLEGLFFTLIEKEM